MQSVSLSTDEQLAQRFVDERVINFKRLYFAIKKLVLDVVGCYLQTYFPFEQEAFDLIQGIRSNPDEQGMVGLYQRFLQFLPVRFRVAVQGRYLYQEPSVEEKNMNTKEMVSTDPREFLKDEIADLGIDPKVFDEVAALEQAEGNPEEKRKQLEGIIFDSLGGQMTAETNDEIKKAIDDALAGRGFDMTTEPGE